MMIPDQRVSGHKALTENRDLYRLSTFTYLCSYSMLGGVES